MDFSKALDALKRGERLQRVGWNGQGMWVRQALPYYGSSASVPYLFLRTATDERVPWTPSQTDLFAEDWQIVG